MNIQSKALSGLAILLLINACTSSQPIDVESTEQLLATPPADWALVYQLNNISSRLSDFVPQGESISDWTTKLSFESFSDLADIDPIQAMTSEVEQDKKRCVLVQHFNLYAGLENGYPSSVRLFMCGENKHTGLGEVKMIKIIQGNDYLYAITIVRRTASFKPNEPDVSDEEIAQWSTYFRGISLCDNAYEEHSCQAK